MKWTGVNELREKFLSFFESKGHTRLSSFPLVPQDDPSLLLINSGMAPLKKFFLGLATPPNTKVTTCQKCIRTPDIENIGKTARHGTYFEMLGNFSFGDYFKEEATTWAWEFFTEVLEIPKEKLYVSVYEEDDEAYDIWTKRRGVDPSHMVRFGKEDNFWEHGSGPCGPCSEIYFDRGPEYSCGRPDCKVGCECDRYMEVWNLVFTQFDSDGAGTYTRLDHPNIDTGMGLERLACVMQGVDNLFEIDTVQNIMKHVGEIAGVTYGADHRTDVSLRVVTDHIRSTTFMVGDGITPSNEGRGYVLRRLLRRAARHGRLMGIHEPFLYKVASTVIRENLSAYPELAENEDYITKVIRAEEERFANTIDQGMDLLGSLIAKHEAGGLEVLAGEDAFRLYDTFGFPIDLTKEICEEKGMQVDEEEFHRLMEQQRMRARTARGASEAWEENPLADLPKPADEHFVGYRTLSFETKILAMAHEGDRVDTVIAGQEAILILEQTPFYAESGGQVGDTGFIRAGNAVFQVTDTKKNSTGHFAHFGRVLEGKLGEGEAVSAEVDAERRAAIARNHSSVHLTQAALREVLGSHVHQAGSYVDEHRARFDFSHFSAMTTEEIKRTEEIVNRLILAALPVLAKEMPIAEAKSMGAMALFGEKYGDIVRVVNMGDRSIELCGGTHVANTANIGLFKIVSESSVAAGVRRIEATTGLGVLELLDHANETLRAAAENLKLSNPGELLQKTGALMAELKAKDRQLEEFEQKMAEIRTSGLFDKAIDVRGIKIIFAGFNGTKPEAIRVMGDKLKEKAPNVTAVLTSVYEGKATLVAVCGKNAVERGVHAGRLIKELCALVGGSGGGRPDQAQGGATEVFKIDEALAKLPEMVEKMLKD